MGRKRKVGPPRGRAGGRKSCLLNFGAERKNHSLYCTPYEYDMAKLLIWLIRAKTMFPTAKQAAFIASYLPTRYAPDNAMHALRLVDLDTMLWNMVDHSFPPIRSSFENLVKTGNIWGDPPAPKSSTDDA